MLVSDSAQELRRFGSVDGRFVAPRTARAACELMLRFFESVAPTEGETAADDGDMLLYQWGTYDWGAGRWFQVNITRQFIRPGEDGGMYQLGLTVYFEPTPATDILGAGDQWSGAPSETAALRAYIEAKRLLR